jgi:hypothetical protein
VEIIYHSTCRHSTITDNLFEANEQFSVDNMMLIHRYFLYIIIALIKIAFSNKILVQNPLLINQFTADMTQEYFFNFLLGRRHRLVLSLTGYCLSRNYIFEEEEEKNFEAD